MARRKREPFDETREEAAALALRGVGVGLILTKDVPGWQARDELRARVADLRDGLLDSGHPPTAVLAEVAELLEAEGLGRHAAHLREKAYS